MQERKKMPKKMPKEVPKEVPKKMEDGLLWLGWILLVIFWKRSRKKSWAEGVYFCVELSSR